MNKSKWIINPNQAGQRLDVFLSSNLPDSTRSGIAKQLKAGAGLVNGKKASVHQFLKAGDKVEYQKPDPKAPSTLNKALRNAAQGEVDVRPSQRTFDLRELIVKETPDWIVVNKPPGLLVHPDSQNKDGTLIDLLIAHFPPLAKVGEDPERPGIVHRLDKDVSGLMIVAKTQDAFDDLKSQFAHHQTKKLYLALVQGAPPDEEGEIRFRIARSGTHARMAARPVIENKGKAAWSHYRVLKKIKNFTLLEVEIMSGRTHQIRAHLFALGCPVVGDELYTNRKSKKTKDTHSTNRIMLQSFKLSFTDPKSGEPRSFELQPDPSFNEFVK